MKKQDDRQYEEIDEIELSVAIVHDIVKRYFNADICVTKKKCKCDLCTNTILAGSHIISVESFDPKTVANAIFCDQNCSEAGEVLEMEFFGCKRLEDLPAYDMIKKIEQDDLVHGYNCRLHAAQQSALDRRPLYYKAYQLSNKEKEFSKE